jgi:hypothetical protein
MSRLVRLLSAGTALHNFGRLRASRGVRSCRDKTLSPHVVHKAPGELPRHSGTMGSALAASKRMAAVRPAPAQLAAPARNAVRVYRGSSGTTMVGRIDAICRMIDRCIADEGAASATAGAGDAWGSV